MNTTGMSGAIRVVRCSITADCAPKLVLRTSEEPYLPTAHRTRSEADASDRSRPTAAGSTAAVSFSAVAILLGKAAAAAARAACVGRFCQCGSWFHQEGRVNLHYQAPFDKPRPRDSCHPPGARPVLLAPPIQISQMSD